MATSQDLQPLKGFRDYYPADFALTKYIFSKFQETTISYGFEQYDGPIVEPFDLYANKSSDELLNEQAFNLTDRDGRKLLLRPEMTPSLARMVAARAMELPYPIRWTNIGLRFRYEAPQKGRSREFYQMDCDILGSDSQIADIEILSLIVSFFKNLGATNQEFEVRINSRSILSKALTDCIQSPVDIKQVIQAIDRKEKVSNEAFEKNLASLGLSTSEITTVTNLLEDSDAYSEFFKDFLALLPEETRECIVVDPCIARGFDYYTGLVFEAKAKKGLSRSIMGGGRYDNLVEKYNAKQHVAGVGFAISNVVIEEFLKENDLLPTLASVPTQVLVTIFDGKTISNSLAIGEQLRNRGIACEVYPYDETQLKKQFEYADKKGIPYVAIIGPDEVREGKVTLKDLAKRTQESLTIEQLLSEFK